MVLREENTIENKVSSETADLTPTKDAVSTRLTNERKMLVWKQDYMAKFPFLDESVTNCQRIETCFLYSSINSSINTTMAQAQVKMANFQLPDLNRI